MVSVSCFGVRVLVVVAKTCSPEEITFFVLIVKVCSTFRYAVASVKRPQLQLELSI